MTSDGIINKYYEEKGNIKNKNNISNKKRTNIV